MTTNQVIRRQDGLVRVYMTSQAPNYNLRDFTVKSGERVQLVLTNLDNVEDLSHGIAISRHDVCFLVNPQDTNSVTFTAGAPGMYWYYCPWFCHALHLEMRGRMFVERA
jgi:nitrous-oxide reductase